MAITNSFNSYSAGIDFRRQFRRQILMSKADPRPVRVTVKLIEILGTFCSDNVYHVCPIVGLSLTYIISIFLLVKGDISPLI